MGWHPHTVVSNKVGELAEKYRLPPATVQALLGEFVQAAHESTFKGTPTDALLGVYHSLGPEAAWHFWGLIYSCMDGDTDHQALWYETAVRLDSQMKRFAHILKQWTEEKEHGLEQERLDAEDRKKNQA